MPVSFIDFKISEMSKMAKRNHELLEDMNSFFATISDAKIREYYSKYGETMFELDLKYVRDNVSDNLKSITNFRDDPHFNRTLNLGQIQKLNEIENLEKDSLNILDNIENIIKNIMENRLNNAIMGTLEDLSRETLMKYKIPPEGPMQSAVLHQDYPGSDNKPYHGDGGFRNRKNKTKNKKYTKKRTHKRPKKRVSKKNKTRKMKKNYL
jgi:hypothetical protein